MAQPIKVDNSHPVTAYDTARILGVSKSRTDELIRAVRRMIHKDDRTGEFVIHKNSARNGSAKARKTNSKRRKATR